MSTNSNLEVALPLASIHSDLIVPPVNTCGAETTVGSPPARTLRIQGKCGELIQGVHPELGAFFVSAALSSCADATSARVDRARKWGVECFTGGRVGKAQQAVQHFLQLSGQDPAQALGHVTLRRRTPVGKGRGSSSIDAALAIFGVAWANDLAAHPHEVYTALCLVERSDPVWMIHDLVLAQPEAGVLTVLGQQPQFLLVGWDTSPAELVDTAQAAELDQFRRRHASEYAELLNMVQSGDRAAIQLAATASSVINHRYLPKPGFNAALSLAKKLNAGLLSAHSGTYLAFLLSPQTDLTVIRRIRHQVKSWGFVPELFLMGGPSAT